jgi:predicted DNA-binding protein
MLTISLDTDTEARLVEQARTRGLSEEAFVRLLIEDGLDERDDIRMATDRLGAPLPTLTIAQARQALGLDD